MDDFDRFIASKYIADKLSIILLSDAIIDTIGTGRFTAVDFVLPPSSYTMVGGRERLTDAEFANIFAWPVVRNLQIRRRLDQNLQHQIVTTMTSYAKVRHYPFFVSS